MGYHNASEPQRASLEFVRATKPTSTGPCSCLSLRMTAEGPDRRRVALWAVCPPRPAPDGARRALGKSFVCDTARSMDLRGVIVKRSAETGEFWVLLRAELPAPLSVLRNSLRSRNYSVAETAQSEVPAAPLRECAKSVPLARAREGGACASLQAVAFETAGGRLRRRCSAAREGAARDTCGASCRRPKSAHALTSRARARPCVLARRSLLACAGVRGGECERGRERGAPAATGAPSARCARTARAKRREREA